MVVYYRPYAFDRITYMSVKWGCFYEIFSLVSRVLMNFQARARPISTKTRWTIG